MIWYLYTRFWSAVDDEPKSLSFTASNYNTYGSAHSILVADTNDSLVSAELEFMTLRHTITDGNYTADPLEMVCYSADNDSYDTDGTTVISGTPNQASGNILYNTSSVSVRVDETVNVGVRLSSPPNTSVIVLNTGQSENLGNTYQSSVSSEISLRRHDFWLVFTPDNYNINQFIEITGRNVGTINMVSRMVIGHGNVENERLL